MDKLAKEPDSVSVKNRHNRRRTDRRLLKNHHRHFDRNHLINKDKEEPSKRQTNQRGLQKGGRRDNRINHQNKPRKINLKLQNRMFQ